VEILNISPFILHSPILPPLPSPPFRGRVKSLEGGVNRKDPNLFMAINRFILYGVVWGGGE